MYTVRPAIAHDDDFLYHLHVATMKPTVSQIWGWDDTQQEEMFRTQFDPSARQIIVVDGQDVGVVEVEWRPTEVVLHNIELLPAYQGQGVGSAIIRDLLGEAHARGLPVTLQVNRVNQARRLYEQLGFAPTGQTETHYLMRATPPDQPILLKGHGRGIQATGRWHECCAVGSATATP